MKNVRVYSWVVSSPARKYKTKVKVSGFDKCIICLFSKTFCPCSYSFHSCLICVAKTSTKPLAVRVYTHGVQSLTHNYKTLVEGLAMTNVLKICMLKPFTIVIVAAALDASSSTIGFNLCLICVECKSLQLGSLQPCSQI